MSQGRYPNGQYAPIEPAWVVQAARQLRKEGWSYLKISKKLEVADSTVREWVLGIYRKDVPMD